MLDPAIKSNTIAIDFDGVLHRYAKGWQGVIPTEDPTQGAVDFCMWLLDKGYKIEVYSARIKADNSTEEIYKWLTDYSFPVSKMKVVVEKPSALLYIDDRGYRFEGNFDEIIEFLERNPLPSTWSGPCS